MDAPFNAGIHGHLLDLGYCHVRHEADWYDDGDAESGPSLAGGPAWDEYSNGDEYLAVEENGTVHGPIPDYPEPPEGWLDDRHGENA